MGCGCDLLPIFFGYCDAGVSAKGALPCSLSKKGEPIVFATLTDECCAMRTAKDRVLAQYPNACVSVTKWGGGQIARVYTQPRGSRLSYFGDGVEDVLGTGETAELAWSDAARKLDL